MARKSQKNVGLIGLGIVGSRIAAVLRSKGYHVCVWNRSPLPEPCFLGSPSEVASVCDVIQLFVADGDAVMAILKAFGDSLTDRHTIVCNATIGPEAVKKAAELVAKTGASFLDAPFTGSKMAAENGALVYYIGGDEAVFTRVEPILRASSKAIVRAGGIGDASVLKIVTNMMVGATVQVLSEATALVAASGVAPERLIDALEHHGVRSGITDMKLANMIRGDFAPHFSVKNMFKDMKIAMNMATPLNVAIPTTSVTAGLLYRLIEKGDKDADFSALITHYAEIMKAATPQPEPQPEPEPEPQPEPEQVKAEEPTPEPAKTPESTANTDQKAKEPATAGESEAKVPDTSSPSSVPSVPLAPSVPTPVSEGAAKSEPPSTAPQILEAEVVSKTSTPTPPTPPPVPTPTPLVGKLRKWFGV